MKDWGNWHKIFGIFFIIFGVIFYLTPIPGTTLLILLGFVWLMGKKRTSSFLNKVLSHKIFKFLRLERIIKKM
ncbi:hypothetical protein A3I95_00685 [Candidatus Nomurabacteria bacterium RIFCSPLOWO2_02_FULL_44_12]|uniref:Uncharacterized protein n=1 Tax=Candidatus Nomurabacteria bacterium RIFCSPLOWO2_12_FULL_44_11 TaxID=1801796 RepID=A0A1F6Y6R9_9BACT|nr:MAG: hypothetical protein A3E95_00540 [Candidatus Nomurabacteria bacterium RIFCSPHIGHO2_12_FULL_44_22b]OGJ02064.1 MAG: hypothetical protein A3G53_03215 [Candidatus Nomurabacteria bacterium RIFCSPLOWO2_12_FULL_44_11]OGJ08707.1 MAG: hypothetical protein A3I95_00685 [Candidatus Nomurabacteria bacterium RIFCSPLOWO2_02_FULL_44_12]